MTANLPEAPKLVTPRAGLTLGIQLGDAHHSLAELNAEFLHESEQAGNN